MATITENRPADFLIDGKRVPARSGENFEVLNPATGEVIGTAWQAGKEDVNAAVAAAKQAHDDRRWRSKSADERGQILWRMAELLMENIDELMKSEMEQLGVPQAGARHMVSAGAEAFRYYAGWATKIHGITSNIALPGKHDFGYTLKQPVGPAGLITPWNFPVLAASWKVAPALAAGCTAVIKPSEETPLSTIRFGELLLEAGVPDGVVNVITGDGRVGAEIVAHPDIRKISFTGSSFTGQKIVQSASGNLKRVTLELGGKSPLVICADADLDRAIQMATSVMYANSGQVCAAGSRLFIEESVYDRVIEGVAAAARHITPGNPIEATTMMGPLVSQKQLAKVTELVESAKTAGARIVTGGARIDKPGFFFPPTLISDVDPSMRVMREEIFGPVVCATPFKDIASVMPLVNDTEFGLAAYIWTRDIVTAHRFAEEVEAGAVFVNHFGGFHYALPFGGFKQSGWGREHAQEGLNAFLEEKKVTFDMTA
jgi:acyl-CoA reductase-like NAD-dependent aldehyde dehydrogenase